MTNRLGEGAIGIQVGRRMSSCRFSSIAEQRRFPYLIRLCCKPLNMRRWLSRAFCFRGLLVLVALLDAVDTRGCHRTKIKRISSHGSIKMTIVASMVIRRASTFLDFGETQKLRISMCSCYVRSSIDLRENFKMASMAQQRCAKNPAKRSYCTRSPELPATIERHVVGIIIRMFNRAQ
jgi:hypothetical protein